MGNYRYIPPQRLAENEKWPDMKDILCHQNICIVFPIDCPDVWQICWWRSGGSAVECLLLLLVKVEFCRAYCYTWLKSWLSFFWENTECTDQLLGGKSLLETPTQQLPLFCLPHYDLTKIDSQTQSSMEAPRARKYWLLGSSILVLMLHLIVTFWEDTKCLHRGQWDAEGWGWRSKLTGFASVPATAHRDPQSYTSSLKIWILLREQIRLWTSLRRFCREGWL